MLKYFIPSLDIVISSFYDNFLHFIILKKIVCTIYKIGVYFIRNITMMCICHTTVYANLDTSYQKENRISTSMLLELTAQYIINQAYR